MTDGTAIDSADAIRYTLEGADDDEDSFNLGAESGALTATEEFDHEDQSSYSLVIVAASGGIDAANREVNDVDRTRVSRLAVTVMVVDKEDGGTVTLSAREPQEGRAVLATLKDDDGGESGNRVEVVQERRRSRPRRLMVYADALEDLWELEDDPEIEDNRVCGDAGNTTEETTTGTTSRSCLCNRWSHIGPLHAEYGRN